MQLLQLVEGCLQEPEVVTMSAAALARIVIAGRGAAFSTSEQLDVLSVLARGMKTQQHLITTEVRRIA